MRPSIPMSPTCVLLGIPPRAMTAQFSNSNGGIVRNCFSVHGRSRTTKPLPRSHRLSSSRNPANIPQPLRHHTASRRRDIDPDPLPVQVLRRHQRRPAPAKRIQNNVVLIRRRLDDPLKQRERLLCRIAEPLACLGIEWRNIVPNVLQRATGHFVEITLVLRHP